MTAGPSHPLLQQVKERVGREGEENPRVLKKHPASRIQMEKPLMQRLFLRTCYFLSFASRRFCFRATKVVIESVLEHPENQLSERYASGREDENLSHSLWLMIKDSIPRNAES